MNHVQRHKKKYQAAGITAVLAVVIKVLLADPNVQCWLNEDACDDTVLVLDGGAP